MWEMTRSQKMLLKGLAELACRLWQLQHSDTYTPADHNSEIYTKRAMSALVKDALKVRSELVGDKGRVWDGLVKMALAITSPIDREAFGRVLDIQFDPPNESVQSYQHSLWES